MKLHAGSGFDYLQIVAISALLLLAAKSFAADGWVSPLTYLLSPSLPLFFSYPSQPPFQLPLSLAPSPSSTTYHSISLFQVSPSLASLSLSALPPSLLHSPPPHLFLRLLDAERALEREETSEERDA